MAFKGLFIGIDRYESPEINWLSCASRDAKALHGLFTDTLGGETTLLTDEQATVAAIRQCFEGLATCDPGDVGVIAFSGHGTETHELVGHDTDPYDLARTTIPLTTLGVIAWLKADGRGYQTKANWLLRQAMTHFTEGTKTASGKRRSRQPSKGN